MTQSEMSIRNRPEKDALKYPIDKNVPLPVGQGRAQNRQDYWDALPYPFSQMQVGDSFFVPVDGDQSNEAMRSKVTNKWVAWRKFSHQPEWQFTSRLVPGGIRVWRIKDQRQS